MKREHIGSYVDDFLKQDGLLAECEAGALKRVAAWQIEREMKGISRAVTTQVGNRQWTRIDANDK